MPAFCPILITVAQYGVMLLLNLAFSREIPKPCCKMSIRKTVETPSNAMFTQLRWMAFPERVNYQKAILVYTIMHNLTPSYLQNLFQFTNEVHTRSLRFTAENLLYIPKPIYENYRTALAYSGSKIWNAILESIKLSNSLSQFKHRYIQWLADQH